MIGLQFCVCPGSYDVQKIAVPARGQFAEMFGNMSKSGDGLQRAGRQGAAWELFVLRAGQAAGEETLALQRRVTIRSNALGSNPLPDRRYDSQQKTASGELIDIDAKSLHPDTVRDKIIADLRWRKSPQDGANGAPANEPGQLFLDILRTYNERKTNPSAIPVQWRFDERTKAEDIQSYIKKTMTELRTNQDTASRMRTHLGLVPFGDKIQTDRWNAFLRQLGSNILPGMFQRVP